MGLSLLDDINPSLEWFCVILSRDLVAHERSLSFTYRRPTESCLGQMYVGKRRASQINLFWEPLNFADDVVGGDNHRNRAILKNRSDALFADFNYGGRVRSPLLVD